MKIKVGYAALESAQLCKAVKDVRTYICGVAFLPDGRVSSTNGHVMFVCGGCDYLGESIKCPVIVNLPKKPVRKYSHAVIDTEQMLVSYFDDMGRKVAIAMVSMIDGKYPDVDRVMNQFKNKNCERVGFNANYLSLIGKLSSLFNPKWQSVTIHLNGATDGALTELTGVNGDAKIMVMPMRID